MQSLVIEGIVLQKINYTDTSVIVKFLTEHEGVKSFIFPGAKSKKKKGNLIAPLSILSLTYYQRSANALATIQEVEPSIVFRDLPFNPYKSSILFFMNEILNNTVKEQEDNSELFQFLKSALQILDLSSNTSNYPIKFLLQLTKYLGFFPKIAEDPHYFDMREGCFVHNIPAHPMYVSESLSKLILEFSSCNLDGINDPQIDLIIRRKLIGELINYYKIIFDNFKDLNSLAVLEATFHE